MASLSLNTALTDRWTPLEPHTVQHKLWLDENRFVVVPAGRRSGKTEVAKRKGIVRSADYTETIDGRFVFAAPTLAQAKKIYWADLKKMIPKWMLSESVRTPISESELTINLCTGTRLEVHGMDKPERIEGSPLDGIVLDEYANMKEEAWTDNIRPALFTKGRKPGWAMLIGVPEGRNHYYDIYQKSLISKNWAGYTWKSSDILPPEEIEQAKEDLDPLTFAQEYEASFVTFAGRAYHQFSIETHCEQGCSNWYDPNKDLIITFDFNVCPGTATIIQELDYEGDNGDCAAVVTVIIGEIYIADNSTTVRVCEEIKKAWKHHRGQVRCYGDAAGGARHTTQTEGTDWDIIKNYLKGVYGHKLHIHVDRSNPSERSRLNAVNSRLRSSNDTIRLLIDPKAAPNVVKDFDGVRCKDDGSIDKKKTPKLTHLSDGIGYYISKQYPVDSSSRVTQQQL